jgi:tRNA(fMet)-specific endonuclease VapC
MLKYMLDTDICIFTIKYKPESVRTIFNRHHGQMAISSVTLMELVYGAEKSARPEENLEVVEGFAARMETLPFDRDAAIHTGQLRAELAKMGTPVGPYDGLIAGHARSRGLIVVTNNRSEFSRIPGLRSEDWIG